MEWITQRTVSFPRAAAGSERDARWMRLALREARAALARGEVPIGAVVVRGDEVVGRGHNRPVSACDPTAHAEVVALRRAARRLRNYRLPGSELFVTVEPCLMCLGACIQARVARVIFAARDPKVGTLGTGAGPAALPGLNHRFAVARGVLQEESKALLGQFFAARREEARERRHRGEVPKWS